MGARKVNIRGVKSGSAGSLAAHSSSHAAQPTAVTPPPEHDEEWFEDREHLQRSSDHGEGDGESIWLLSYADMMTLLFGFFVMVSSFSKLDVESFDKMRRETTQLFGGEYSRSLVPGEKLNDDLSDAGLTEKAFLHDLDKDGVSITFRGSVFFENASTEVRAEAVEMLKSVIQSIKRQPTRFKVIVEGHTDDKPVTSGKYPSNWELSGLRASAVLRLFEASGFDRSLLSAVGYGDSQPVLPNHDANGQSLPENQNQNRRVVIKLIKAPAKP